MLRTFGVRFGLGLSFTTAAESERDCECEFSFSDVSLSDDGFSTRPNFSIIDWPLQPLTRSTVLNSY